MAIKEILMQAVAQLEREHQQQVEVVRQKVMQEEIAPFNRDIDISLDKAVTQLTEELNRNISLLQEKYQKDKAELFEAGEKKKKDNMESVLSARTCSVNVSYSQQISKIKSQIEEMGE